MSGTANTPVPVPFTPVSVALLTSALREAGLLVSIDDAPPDAPPDALSDIADDSRLVVPGGAFIAVRGSSQNGHDWLPQAEAAGAALAFVDEQYHAANASARRIPSVVVRDGRRAAAVLAAAFFGWPANALSIIGVTGTNGKTTTVALLRGVLDATEAPSASIGTLGVRLGADGAAMDFGGGLTTPGPVSLQRLLRLLVDRGVRWVAMEVSSHALDQRRVDSVSFAAAVFTNLTQDHLDYHVTMDGYRQAKLRLVGLVAAGGASIFNADDPAWQRDTNAPRALTFGMHSNADVSARDIRFGAGGSRFLLVTPTGAAPVVLPLFGEFNVANALGAAAAAFAVGVPVATIAERLGRTAQVPGRLERLWAHPAVLRDYAHTPDALERALRAVRPFAGASDDVADPSTNGDDVRAAAPGRLIVLFGCGGDRDRGKRPLMGAIAERIADVVIVTSDNPRTEDPGAIIDDIETGMSKAHERIVDRAEAIERALDLAGPDDVVLLAGKGHETYQIRGTTSYPFDEREIVARSMQQRAGDAV